MFDEAGKKRTAEVREFIKEVAAWRLTREGRFIRVHFVTGHWVDLVPPGSLATGHFLKEVDGKRKWELRNLDMDLAWKRFKRRKREKRLTAN